MQNQMSKIDEVISGGYLSMGIDIKGLCGVNATKTREFISQLMGF